MSTAQRTDVAVVGVGRMGRHHVRIYDELEQANLVAVVDQDEERAETVADEFGCKAYPSIEALLEHHPDIRAVSVAVPTNHHVAAAQPLLARRVACLIEKPLAPTVKDAKILADTAKAHHAVLQVGHTERFNPAIRAVATLNVTPRFIDVDRVSPMTFRSLDVGVVMDMMIHDLDIILMLVDSPIRKIDAAGVSVLGPHEDIASARIVFDTGCVANLTASRMSMKVERKMRLFSEQVYVSLDYQKRGGMMVRKTDNNMDALTAVREQISQGKDLSDLDYSSMIQIEELMMDLPPGEDDPLTAELTSFIKAAQTGQSPAVDADAGYAAVAAAERVIAAIRDHKWRGLDDPRLVIGHSD